MEKQKLVKIEWDADDDSYLLFIDANGKEPVARMYTQELEDLEGELKRVFAEMTA